MGYEILYRSSATSHRADFENQDQAAAQVVVDSFMNLGADSVLGEGIGFFNATAAVLEAGVMKVLPPDRTVVEILEDISPSPRLVQICRDLGRAGYTLALDDYVPGDPREELLDLVDWVKVDLLETDPKQLRRLYRELRRAGPKLLAEKVSSWAEFERCRALGFDAFQGFYFAQAEIVSGKAPEAETGALLDLMGRVQGDAETHEVAQKLKQHADLSLGLVRIANSASMARAQSLSSVEDALVYLGRRQLQRWIAILLFANNRPGGHRDPLLITAAKRGRLLELLACRLSGDVELSERAFLVGILASIDALLGRPKEELLRELNLAEEALAALLDHSGCLGQLLCTAEAFEVGDFSGAQGCMEGLGISPGDFQEDEDSAYDWVHGLVRGLGS